MKKTVSIGISLHNEEVNITRLLAALQRQKAEGFRFAEILLISDGSTDGTNSIIKQIASKNPHIKLIIGRKRRGKPTRVNQLFRTATSDVLVILDGDIRIKSDTVISRLVTPIITREVDLTSGKAKYLPPKTFFEKIMSVGIDMWCEVKETAKNAEMYTCEGPIRAFSKKLYQRLTFPPYSAEDVYPYLYCKKYKHPYHYVRSAIIYYQLPATVTDFTKQHTRYLHSREVQRKNFSRQIIKENYIITNKEKIAMFKSYLIKQPLPVILYSLLLLIPKIEAYFETESLSAKWSIIDSTKK